MGENDFEIGEKVSWTYMNKEVPGVVKDKSDNQIIANSGGKNIKRNAEPGNPAYVLAMDKGDSKDGKEVAKKGSNLHSRKDSQEQKGANEKATEATQVGDAKKRGEQDPGKQELGGKQVMDPPELEEEVNEEVMEEDEAAAGGKDEEEALEAQLKEEDEAAEDGGAGGVEPEEGILKRKPLDAVITRGDATKVAKMAGPASNTRSTS